MQVSQMAASVGAAAGAAGTVVASTTDRIGWAISGSAVLIVSAMILCVQAVLRAIRDTAAERAALIEERELAIAAQAGVVGERERLRSDFARNRKAAQDLLARERRALYQTLAEERFSIQSEGVEMGIRLALSGTIDEAPEMPAGVLVPFPARQLDDAALAASDD